MRVGYNESSYILSEANGYVEVCVNATSPGISEEFNIHSTSTENMISEYMNLSVDVPYFLISRTLHALTHNKEHSNLCVYSSFISNYDRYYYTQIILVFQR